MTETSRCTAILLAAQRAGVVNPLAERAGVSHKCLAPICGKPLIVHVMDALAAVPSVSRVRVSVEPELHADLGNLLARYAENGCSVEFVPSSHNIVDSVLTSADGCEGPFVITTADNVLLSPEALQAVLDAMRSADAVMNLATRESVKTVHEDAQHFFYQFRDGGYANCNLFGIAGRHAFSAMEIFREGGQFMNHPRRLLTAFGFLNIILFRFKLVTLQAAARRMSKRFGLKFAALIPQDGAQAVDVDNERTFAIAEMVLMQRQAKQ